MPSSSSSSVSSLMAPAILPPASSIWPQDLMNANLLGGALNPYAMGIGLPALQWSGSMLPSALSENPNRVMMQQLQVQTEMMKQLLGKDKGKTALKNLKKKSKKHRRNDKKRKRKNDSDDNSSDNDESSSASVSLLESSENHHDSSSSSEDGDRKHKRKREKSRHHPSSSSSRQHHTFKSSHSSPHKKPSSSSSRVRDPKNKSKSVVLEVLDEKLNRSSPSHDPL